jgi:hypothetical protein
MEFLIAGVFALICCLLVVTVRESDASQPHVEVSGTLADYEVIGRRKSPALRFRLREERLDFRVDPAIFREAMNRAVPVQFQRDAPVRILVMAEEYAQPVRPLLNSDVQIAWVHGLSVGDQEAFSVADVFAWERKNQRWSYALLAFAVLLAAYFGIRWRLSRRPTSRSNRSRAKTRAPG